MMKILTTTQIKALDNQTIQEQHIQSIDLMERAAKAFVDWFTKYYDKNQQVQIMAGTGNNGGDGLAIGRLLYQLNYAVTVYAIRFNTKASKDFKINLERLKYIGVPLIEVAPNEPLPPLHPNAVIIDAILGSGLSRPIKGWLGEVVTQINQCPTPIIAVDIPSGTFADKPTEGISIEATQTFSFELPKLAFFLPSNEKRIGEWQLATIQSSPKGLVAAQTPYYYVTPDFVKTLYKKRNKFDHKGKLGRALLIMGSYGMIGAALLAAKACLRSGAGLVTAHLPKCGYVIAQTAVPELMVSLDSDEHYFSHVPFLGRFTAIGMGCGLSIQKKTYLAVGEVLSSANQPLVLDADALNIIARSKMEIPKDSILTPHVREFARLFGETDSDIKRLALQCQKAKQLGVYIVLKGAHTAIACPDGQCYFNSTGNPGMATGGSGDVLTGLITGLLAQGYEPKAAAILGVYLHGMAGDIAAKQLGQEALIASDIIDNLGRAYLLSFG